MTFGMQTADIRPAKDFEISTRGLHGTLQTPAGAIRVDSTLLGRPNLYNWMGAIGAAIVVGMPPKQIETGIRNLQSVRGRFEYVHGAPPSVIVDYAHKPDALEKLHAFLGGSFWISAKHLDLRQRQVAEDGEVREQLEMLENHPDAGP